MITLIASPWEPPSPVLMNAVTAVVRRLPPGTLPPVMVGEGPWHNLSGMVYRQPNGVPYMLIDMARHAGRVKAGKALPHELGGVIAHELAHVACGHLELFERVKAHDPARFKAWEFACELEANAQVAAWGLADEARAITTVTGWPETGTPYWKRVLGVLVMTVGHAAPDPQLDAARERWQRSLA